ncbi:MAG: MarR family transcriptional regulator [Firmicutes bacterium]|nr:MarR family transcriptional regulator [Bacillota bacterium]
MEKYDALKLENQLCFPLYAASRAVVRRYRPFLAELGLTYTQYIAMMVLWEERKLSVKELGARLFLDSGTLTPLLKSMERKGLVTRKRACEDERVLLVEVTEQGMALREKALGVPPQIASCLRLEEEEAKQLYVLAYKVLAAAEG